MRRNLGWITLNVTLALLAAGARDGNVRADDWPQWGGPQRDLVWRESGIVDKFSTTEMLPRVWSTPISEGYSGPAVAAGKVYITDRLAEQHLERVHCLDADTGKIIWTHKYPCIYTVSYPAGPRTTPLVDEDRVYTLGAESDFHCLRVSDGKVLWSKNFHRDYDLTLPIWGSVASPIIDGNQVIALVGGPKSLVVSFDKLTGKENWRALDDATVGYAPPVIFTFGQTRQLIAWHPRALSSLDPTTGKLIWEVPFSAKAGLSVATPRKIGNQLFVTCFYNGSMLVDVAADGRSAKPVWRGKSDSEIQTDGLHSIMATPWVNENNIYGVCSYGQLRCLELATGKRIWETFKATGHARWWNVFIIPHQDHYFLHNEQGDLIIANLSPSGYEELSRAKLIEPTRPVLRRTTIWSHPAFAMKSVFARNDKEIIRVNLAAGTGK